MVFGVWLLQQQSHLMTMKIAVIALFAASVMLALSLWLTLTRLRFGGALVIGLRCVSFLAWGFCWATLIAQIALHSELASELENQDLIAVGVIDSLPNHLNQGLVFNFRIEELKNAGMGGRAIKLDYPRHVMLTWIADISHPVLLPELKPGERWRLNLRLKRVHGNANPDGFDFEVWMLEQGLRASGSVRSDTRQLDENQNRRLETFVWSVANQVERIRYVLRERILRALPNAAFANVMTALVVGDQHDITQAEWRVFNRTGIAHLVSISGLHITMVAGLFAGCLSFFWRRSFFTSAQLPLRIPTAKIAALGGAIAALAYVALAGFGVPAQRTLVMLLVIALALWTGRMTSMSQVLCLALATVVVFDPWSVLWPGFWLSFAAVGVLIYAGKVSIPAPVEEVETQSRLKKLLRGLFTTLQHGARAQYVVTIGLVPLTLLLFGQVSIVSPIANAIAIPLISLIIAPLALLGSVLPAPLSVPCLQLAHTLMAYLAHFLTYLSQSPMAVWSTPLPSGWMFLLALVGVLWMLAPRGFPLRFLGVVCCFPIVLNLSTHPVSNEFRATAFDVGQGSAVLIETASHRLLYDTGPGFSAESNSGTRVLLPYFQTRGIHHLDRVVVSHADSDHSGGALSLLAGMAVDQLDSSLRLDHPIVLAAKKHQRCMAGQSWDWDGVHFEVLHPVPVIYTSDKWKTNALSCTLKISNQHHSLLLTGDIEAIQEDELVNSIPTQLKSDVLLAPHHGSSTSSTAAFLDAVRPQWVVFQMGYLNRFHHPRPEVVQRYREIGALPLRTDICGAIALQFDVGVTVSAYRQEHVRYWYGR